MGLGPEVCIDCVRIFDYVKSEEERQEIKRVHPDFVCYWCSKCGKTKSRERAFTISEQLLDTMLENRKKEELE